MTKRPLMSLLLLAVAVLLVQPYDGWAAQGGNEQEKQKTRRTPAISEAVYKKLAKVQEFMDAKDYDGALAELANIEQRIKRYNGYEKAQVYNMLAFAWYSKENSQKAIHYYQKILEQGDDIPLAMEQQTTYALAQLYFVEEQYQKSVDFMRRWFQIAENPGPQPYIFLAQVYYSMKQYEKGIEPVRTAMDIARQRGEPVKEDWWLLLRVLYYELERWDKVMEVLEVLVRDFPKKEYWVQLSGVYGQEGYEDKQLGALLAAYYQGYLDRGRELMNLAGLLLQAEDPMLAAKVMQYGFDNDLIEKDDKNVQQLAQAYHLAQEVEKAIPYYEEAGKLAEHGRILQRLASVYLDTDQYRKCAEAAKDAIDKGGLRNEGDAWILKGMCEYNLDRLTAASRSFREARRIARRDKDRATANNASNWLKFLARETKRREQIAAAAKGV